MVEQTMTKRFVYVIGAQDGLQKIGRSRNPARRLSAFQFMCDGKAVVHFALELPEADACATEKHAHWLARALRREGEWFAITPELAQRTVEVAYRQVRRGDHIGARPIQPIRGGRHEDPVTALEGLGWITAWHATLARKLRKVAGRSIRSHSDEGFVREPDHQVVLNDLEADIRRDLGHHAAAVLKAIVIDQMPVQRLTSSTGGGGTKVAATLRDILDLAAPRILQIDRS